MAADVKFPNPCFLLEDGEFKRIDFQIMNLGPQDAMLKELSGSMPTTVPSAFTIGENVCGIQVKGASIVVWAELAKLTIDTVYAPVASTGEFYPMFRSAPNKGTLEQNRQEAWLPNQFKLRLFFIVGFTKSGDSFVASKESCFLVAKKEGQNQTMRPPLPNIYTDGRLCMGDFGVKEKILEVAFAKALTHLHNSRWNSDLLDDMSLEDIAKIFTFKDGVNKPPPARFDVSKVPQCINVNNQIYSDLPLV